MKSPVRACSVFLVLLILAVSAIDAKPCLEISLREQGDRLTLAAAGATVRPNRPARTISREFRTIYEALEKNSRLAGNTDALIEKLGQELLGPLASKITGAACVVFQIQPGQMHFALDLLPVNGSPLFTQKPVGYSFKANTDFDQRVVQNGAKGLIVRDPDTDPQDGAKMAHGFFPQSKLYFMKETSLRVFSGRYDFILISGHGGVTMPWDASDDADDDSIGFNDDELTADVLGKSKHRLVYLDSCQLGMSRDFIEAARDAGAKYYLAPIISNEAGNSSTKTIKYFFGALRDGQTPMEALFTARTRLYNEFKGKPREKLLYYAYPFRVYGF